MSEEACTRFIPHYSFCCHQHYRSLERRAGGTIKRKSYEDRHIYCYQQPGGKKPPDDPLLETLKEFQDCEYVNDSRWSRLLFTDRLPVLMVSKALREEALEVFYSTNTFSFGDRDSFNMFIQRVDMRRAVLIRKIELNATIETDAGTAPQFRVYISTMPPNWIFDNVEADSLEADSLEADSLEADSLEADTEAAEHKVSKLVNVTDVILRLHDKMPVVGEVPEKWEQSRHERHVQLQESLSLAFMGINLLENLKRIKVRIVCAKMKWDQEPCLQAQADYELDRDALRVVEDEFASELMAWRNI
ncbi:MAG: hypothetical protein OHK93_003035 [Ramalina farinacea]|uniref:Uncharacterized protein n=1 Tax=Ramalina farinacea TaxID=258253 RepID=A0AA43QUI8_9LECA|nr:hypothetical protein [Ramalina farinacea]